MAAKPEDATQADAAQEGTTAVTSGPPAPSQTDAADDDTLALGAGQVPHFLAQALADGDISSDDTLAPSDFSTSSAPSAVTAQSPLDPDTDFASDVTVAEGLGATPASGATPAGSGSAPTERVAVGASSGSEVDATEAQAGERIGEEFEIIRTLGAGGMGTVYLGRDLRLGRRVAIKVMKLGGRDAAARAKLASLFTAEARSTARLNHPSVVTIHQVGEHRGQPYLVLELLDGESMHERIVKERPSLAEALQWLMEICRALVHAHGQGLVHRDLKPHNVFLTEDGQLKVVDFGLATFDPRRIDAAADGGPGRQRTTLGEMFGSAEEGSISGSPAYMAPEQWRGQVQDARTDIWACGVILYQLLTGTLPFAKPLSILTNPATPLPSERVPGLPRNLDAIVERCLERAPEKRFQSARDLLEALIGVESAARKGQAGEPYRYLEPFGEADAGWFFGRDRESAQLAHMASTRALIAIVGPSGAGKSSLARAGLLGRLRLQDERWTITSLVPGRTPLQTLGNRVAELAPEAWAALGGADVDLQARPGFIGEVLRRMAKDSGHKVMVLVDQLEELFTLEQAPGAQSAFAAALLSAADDPAAPLRVVVTMRDDFLSALSATPALRDAIVGNLLALGTPDAKALQGALEGPARELGFAFEEGLSAAMIEELRKEPAPLPLLQFAASRLWEARDTERKLLTARALDAMGGLSGLLASHGEAILAGMDSDDVQRARIVLCGLVTPSGTRRAMSPNELAERCSDAAAALRVIDRLVQGRLLAVVRSERDVQVQLAHESLIARWDRLHGWLGDDADRRLLRERVGEATKHWQEAGRPREMLWGGEPLARARSFDAGQLGLRTEEREFLDASAVAERTQQRRRKVLVGIAIATAVVVTVGSWAAMIALGKAADEARGAERDAQAAAVSAQEAEAHAKVEAQKARDARADGVARVLAALAESKLQSEPMAALRLARSAVDRKSVAPAVDAVHKALLASLQRRVLDHGRPVVMSRWLPDATLLTLDKQGVIRLHRANGEPLPAVTASIGAAPTALAVPPHAGVERQDPKATGNSVSFIGAEDGGVYRLAQGHLERVAMAEGKVMALAATESGDLAFGALSDKGPITFLRQAAEGAPPSTPFQGGEGHPGGALSLGWLPGPQRFVSGGADGRLLLHRADGRFDRVLGRHGDAITTTASDAAGGLLIAGSLDGTASLWRDGREQARLRGHDGWVTAVAVRGDGQQVATGSNDESVRLYSGEGTFLTRVGVHDYGISALRYAPAEAKLLSVSLDGTAALLGPDGKLLARLVGHDQPLVDGDFSHNGEHIATASEDTTARIWASYASEGARVDGAPCEVGRVALRADSGALVAIGEGDLFEACPAGAARLYRLEPDAEHVHAFKDIGQGLGVITAAAWLGRQHAAVGDDKGGLRVVDSEGAETAMHQLGAAVLSLHPDDAGAFAVAVDGTALRLSSVGAVEARLAGRAGAKAVVAAGCGGGMVRVFADGQIQQVDSRMTALQPMEAAQKWADRKPTAAACDGSFIAVGDGKGGIRSHSDGSVAAHFDAHPGGVTALVWVRTQGDKVPLLVSAGHDGQLAAFGPGGEARWRSPRLGEGAIAALGVDPVDGLICGLGGDGALHALRTDGTEFATLRAPLGAATGLSLGLASGEVALLVRGQGAALVPLRLTALEARAKRSGDAKP